MKALRLTIVILLIMPFAARADSPITSTDFYEAYKDVPVVQKAAEAKMMKSEFAEYLMSPDNPIDVKAAVVNAIGWNIDGKSSADLFKIYLAAKYGIDAKALKTSKLTADELFCLGYLTVLDDYFHPEKGIPLLEKAALKNPKSFTVAMILALAKAQKAMDASWCDMWKLTNGVVENPNLARDMRPEAVRIIMDYMVLYRDECGGE